MLAARWTVLVFLAFTLKAEVSALHPRIYVRNDRASIGTGLKVSVLRARWNDAAYARFRSDAKPRGVAGIAEIAARFLASGNTEDLANVRDFLGSRTFSYEKNDVGGFLAGAEMALAFDWVYEGLSPEERARAAANIVTTAESSARFLLKGQPDINHNYTYMALNTVVVCGLVLTGEPEPYAAKPAEYLRLAREFLEGPGRVLDTWNARQGAWSEGSHYTFHETLRTLVLALHAYRSATDTDYFPRIRSKYGDFVRKAGRFLIGCMRPDFTFVRTGDIDPSRVFGALTIPLTVEMLAAGVEDRDESARLHSFAQALLQAYGSKAVWPEFHWGMRIFYDPRETVTPSYTSLPLFMRFGPGTYEQFVFRDGWDAGSTHITVLAGDQFTDHQHFDKGQFLIYRRGGLAVDSGTYDGMYRPGGHGNEYSTRTLAHDCLLVFDADEVLPRGYSNDGGQNIIRGKQHHPDWQTYQAHRDAEGLHTGEVLAYDARDGQYAFLRVELKGAYGAKVEAYERQFAYLPAAGFLLVYDRVSVARPEFETRWLLHTQDRPVIDGREPEVGVETFPGATLARMHRAAEGGTLALTALLPAERKVVSVGGPGYEFFNTFTGMNYPVSNERLRAPEREAGAWRIEIAPAKPAKELEFLSAIQIGEGELKPVASRLIRDRDGKAVGVHLALAGREQVVLFGCSQLPHYGIDSAGPTTHLITGLPAGLRVRVRVNGKTVARSNTGTQGIIRFEDRGRGTRTVTFQLDGK